MSVLRSLPRAVPRSLLPTACFLAVQLLCGGLPEARVGDPVVLWGPELPVETIADAAGTIGYELTCSITRRVRFVEA